MLMSYSNWLAFPVSLVGKYFLNGAGFWEACPRKCETRSSGLSLKGISITSAVSHCTFGKVTETLFLSFQLIKAEEKLLNPIRGCCEGQLSHDPEELGNHLMKAICWCWAHLRQV